MSLTLGAGPLAAHPAGAANYTYESPKHKILWQPWPRRIRAVVGQTTILDSTGGHLLHESNILPRLYVPFSDLDEGVLEATEHTTHCPFKGDASYWSIRVGDRVEENAVWGYPEPVEGAEFLEGFVSVYPERVDLWLQEDEPVFAHFRDPYHRVDVLESSRHARVTLDGETIAETARPKLVFETSIPVRVYVPRADVSATLERSETVATCPYKGQATYWHVNGGEDLAWSYETPLAEATKAQGHVSFDGDGIAVELDDPA